MKTWHWLVIIIGLFICGLFVGYLFLERHWVVNRYDVFRDVLSIILVVVGLSIALLGAAIYALVSSALDVRVEKKVEEQINFATSKLYIQLSFIYWEAYEVNGKFIKKKKNDLRLAIEQAENAWKKLKNLDEKKFERWICTAKNNLAYHLAAKKDDHAARRAIPYAKYAYDKEWEYDFEQTWHWVETYAFVLIRLGDQKQKEEGKEIIRKTLKREDLPDSAKKYIRQKYSGRGLLLGPTWI